MLIDTKANLGDEIFYMSNNKVKSDTVKYIGIDVVQKQAPWTCEDVAQIKIEYQTESTDKVPEALAFLTKEDLLNSL